MMRRFWTQPLQRQLVIAIVLLLVPVLGAAIWAGVVTYRERVADVRDQTQALSMTTAAWVNRDLDIIDRMAVSISGLDAVQRLDESAADLLRRAVISRPSWSDILLVRRDGTLAARGATVPPAVDPGTAWVSEVLEQHNRVVLPLAVRTTPQYVLLGYPIEREGRIVGALGYVITLQALQDALAALPLPPGSVITVTDRESRILARTIDPEHMVGRLLYPGQQTFTDAARDYERVGPDGIRRIYGESVADKGPWLVSVEVPVSVVAARATSLWMRNSTILLLGIAGWVIVAIVLSRRLTGAVDHLRVTALRIARGDFSPIRRQPKLSREFGDLEQAFDEMLQRFNESRAALDAQMAEERRMREELESLQSQVIRQERLAAVGQLVSGVAHEINNPLQAILGFAELLQMQSDVPDTIKDDLRLIQKESARACAIIRNLAMFARQQPGQAATVHLGDVVSAVAELRHRRLHAQGIELSIDDRSTQPVMALITELQQVVLNFVVNAEQAIVMAGRLPGRITVRTYDVDAHALLEVEDTGPGVPVENESKLFQPFFTTKPVGQGTGLGLSVSYGIVESMGGRIGYRRAATGGAIFYFELPAAAATHA